jgi:hypothetical protein
VDLSGCYGELLARTSVYWGQPVVLEPGEDARTLREEVEYVSKLADRDAWIIRVSGPITGLLNALIPSTPGALTSANFRKREGVRRRQAREAFRADQRSDRHAMRDAAGSRLYGRVVEGGVVTWATWAMIQALPAGARASYEALKAESVIFYPRDFVASTPDEYEALVCRSRREGLPWQSTFDAERWEVVTHERLDERHVALRYRIGEDSRRINDLRQEAKRANDAGRDKLWKTTVNTMFGVLASPHLPTGNFVAANQVTAWGRALAFAMSQSLNAVQTITDGVSYRRDQVPAAPYADCLEAQADYPVRRAEGGIAFKATGEVPDDTSFTPWYRAHVKAFFNVSGSQYDDLFDVHELIHKTVKVGGQATLAFDALGCDGAGNYFKCLREEGGRWVVTDQASRGFRREARKVLEPWLLLAYSLDHAGALPPLVLDRDLLSVRQAAQQARKALRKGAERVVLPLGFELEKVLGYQVIKMSAFIFDTPQQHAAVLRQVERFKQKAGCGLDILALRRSYRERKEGSLSDLAQEVHDLIREGRNDLAAMLNVRKLSPALRAVAAGRLKDLQELKARAEQDLLRRMLVTERQAEEHLTGWLLTREHLPLLDRILICRRRNSLLGYVPNVHMSPQPDFVHDRRRHLWVIGAGLLDQASFASRSSRLCR